MILEGGAPESSVSGARSARAWFPRSIRLRCSEDFKRVRDRGRRVHTRHLVVQVCRGPGQGESLAALVRFGFAVSRKVGNAVARNRVKRRLREASRHERIVLTQPCDFSSSGARSGDLEKDGWYPSLDIVIIARPSAATASAQELRAEVAEALRQSLRSPVASSPTFGLDGMGSQS